MKVALINPSQKFLTNPSMAEPLGLWSIESALECAGIDVELVDLSFDNEIPEADIYGFTGSSIQFPEAVKLASNLKKKGITVIGGPHASALPNRCLEHFDAVVVGPGEKAIIEIVNDVKNSKSLRPIYNCPIDDINSLPIPRRNSLKRINYTMKNSKFAAMLTSRGCPYQCSFCASNAIWGRNVKYYSLKRIIDELLYLTTEFGVSYFKFVDDIFTLNKKRFLSFSKEFAKLNIKWICESRIDSIDRDILQHMVKMGCDTIDLGVESVEDQVLSGINKNQTIRMVKKVISEIKQYGIKIKVYIIYGLPFESRDIVKNTINFVKEVSPDYVSLFTLTPYPGTDIWENPDKYNIKRISEDFSGYKHAVGGELSELDSYLNVEYNDRSSELLRRERNELRLFAKDWNTKTENKII